MGNLVSKSKIDIDADDIIAWSAKLPTVHVDREKYLRAQFDKHCDDELLEKVVEFGPVKAGIPTRTINLIAKSAITHETALVTLISTAAGIPGGVFMWGTIPGDIAQFHGAMIRTAQKLAYIHGWPEFFDDKGDNIDDDTRGVLLMFLGVMYGIAGASGVLEKVSAHFATVAVKKLPEKALTKGLVYPVVKRIAKAMSIKMTKSIFANGVGKAIPVLGGVLSGSITYASFRPMANRLNAHLIKRNAMKKRAIKRSITA